MVKSGCKADKKVVDHCTASPVIISGLWGKAFVVVQDAFNDVTEVCSWVDLFGAVLFSTPDAGNAVAASGFRVFQAFQSVKEQCKVSFLQRDVIVFREGNEKITIIERAMY